MLEMVKVNPLSSRMNLQLKQPYRNSMQRNSFRRGKARVTLEVCCSSLHSLSAAALALGLHNTNTQPFMGIIAYNVMDFYLFSFLILHYHRRGERLVASTYSPHMQTSPPITSFFCSSVPVRGK